MTSMTTIRKIYTAYIRIDGIGASNAYSELCGMKIEHELARTISRRRELPYPLSGMCDDSYPITERELVLFARQGIFPRFNIRRFARPTPEAIEATNTHTLGDTSPAWISDGLPRSLRRMFPYYPHFTYGVSTTPRNIKGYMGNLASARYEADHNGETHCW